MLTSLAACIVVPLLFVLWNARGGIRHAPWPAVAAILWFGAPLAHAAVGNIRQPHEWDFGCFWLYGHVAAAHLNLYDPTVFARFPSPFGAPSAEFRAAVLDVGFPYPPPTALLFVPLALIGGVHTELAVWYAVQLVALVGAAWLLARAFLPEEGWRGALLVLAVTLALPAALANVNDAQTNFLALLAVAFALGARNEPAGAIWQIVGMWIKPYIAVLFVLDVVRGRVSRLAIAAGAAALSLGIAFIVLGRSVIREYIGANPAGREPSFAFVEPVNASLLAVVLRHRHAPLAAHVAALHEPLYLAAAALLAAVTLALCVRARRAGAVPFALVLLLGLLVYPASLVSYGVVAVVPLLVIWEHRDAFPGGASSVAAISALAIAGQAHLGDATFAANLLLWLACAYLLAVEGKAPPTRAATATLVAEPPLVGAVR